MNPKDKTVRNQVEIFEDTRAKFYDEFVKVWILNYEFVLDALCAIFESNPSKIKQILVAGCGTGNEIHKLLLNNPSYSITGVDPSKEMIAQAKQKLGETKNIKLRVGTTDTLDPIQKYDAATLFLVLQFMKDDGAKEYILKSIADRLLPNAPFVLLDIFGSQEEFTLNLQLLKELLPEELHGCNIPKRIATLPNRISPISEERLNTLLTDTGFTKPIRFFQSAIYGGWICRKK